MTDWRRHGSRVPLTRMRVTTAPPHGLGTVLVARTGIGRIAFDDPMRVTVWDPPRLCRLDKTGRAVVGWAEIRVEPDGAGGSVVRWREDARPPWLPRAAGGLVALGGRLVFGREMDALLAP